MYLLRSSPARGSSGRRPTVRIRYYAEVYRRNKQAWPIMQKRCFPNDGNWNWISDGECGDGGDGGVEKNEGRESSQSPPPPSLTVGVGGD